MHGLAEIKRIAAVPGSATAGPIGVTETRTRECGPQHRRPGKVAPVGVTQPRPVLSADDPAPG
jgi:hypothetical protein